MDLNEIGVVFCIKAKQGFTQLINNLQPTFNDSVIDNKQFVFDNKHYIKYDVSKLTNTLDFGTNKDFTIQCICRMTSQPNSWEVPFVNSNNWSNGTIMIQFNRSGKRFGLYWNGVTQGSFSDNYYDNFVSDHNLYHLALVRKQDKIMTFVNGKLDLTIYSTSGNANFASKSGSLWIGHNAVDGGFFNGNIKYLKIINYAKYEKQFNVNLTNN